MIARIAFRRARSLYRRGLREPAVHCPGEPELAARNAWARPSIRRPLCEQGTAIACRIDQRAITFLGRRPPERNVSVPRWHYQRATAPMFDWRANGERVPVPPCRQRKARALQELRGRLNDARCHGLTYTEASA